jgi:hypothetical protein
MSGLGHSADCRSWSEGTIHDLVDGVNRFPLTGAAAQYKDSGDQVKVRIVLVVNSMALAILLQNNGWDTHGFTAVAAKDSAKVLRR